MRSVRAVDASARKRQFATVSYGLMSPVQRPLRDAWNRGGEGEHAPDLAGPRSASGSEKVRSRWHNALARLGFSPQLAWSPRPGFGMGSVGRGGSVGAAKTRPRPSAYSHRTGLSVVLKIRVSMVRFRPWPPSFKRTRSRRRLLYCSPACWRASRRVAIAASSFALKPSVASMRSTSARCRSMSVFTVAISAR
jgi:hypothetical protein